MTRHNFHACQPILRVDDMKRALDFYVGVLGFSNAPWGDDDFTSINRDDAGIYLCRKGQGAGQAWVWMGVENVDRLHAELVARGVAIRHGPVTYSYAREMHVEDPDGNVIRFGSDPEGETD
jgi:predicted enzyme related to lactoylglutathione lyase